MPNGHWQLYTPKARLAGRQAVQRSMLRTITAHEYQLSVELRPRAAKQSMIESLVSITLRPAVRERGRKSDFKSMTNEQAKYNKFHNRKHSLPKLKQEFIRNTASRTTWHDWLLCRLRVDFGRGRACPRWLVDVKHTVFDLAIAKMKIDHFFHHHDVARGHIDEYTKQSN